MMMDQILLSALSALNFMTAMITHQLLFHADIGWFGFVFLMINDSHMTISIVYQLLLISHFCAESMF